MEYLNLGNLQRGSLSSQIYRVKVHVTWSEVLDSSEGLMAVVYARARGHMAGRQSDRRVRLTF